MENKFWRTTISIKIVLITGKFQKDYEYNSDKVRTDQGTNWHSFIVISFSNFVLCWYHGLRWRSVEVSASEKKIWWAMFTSQSEFVLLFFDNFLMNLYHGEDQKCKWLILHPWYDVGTVKHKIIAVNYLQIMVFQFGIAICDSSLVANLRTCMPIGCGICCFHSICA